MAPTSNDYRYERKFVVSGISISELFQNIRLHPAMFSEMFYERKINNIYFDTRFFQSFYENIYGLSDRKKYRVRWYGDTFGKIEKPVLEIKIKKGFLGSKLSYPCLPIDVEGKFSIKMVNEIIQQSELSDELKNRLKHYSPVLINSYTRKYFESSCKSFRLTVDSNQQFYKIRQKVSLLSNVIMDDTKFILELKYQSKMDSAAEIITNNFPFRITKNSKYVNGLIS
jgi:SPX domain protein involved in polyphosphate accumulation